MPNSPDPRSLSWLVRPVSWSTSSLPLPIKIMAATAFAFVGFTAFASAVSGPAQAAQAKGARVSPSPSPSASPSIAEYRDEIERDFVLRSRGVLHVTNLRGDIVIQGWPLDKIRVKARRRAVAADPEEAKRLFSAVDFRFKAGEGQVELSAEYGRGLTLQERLRERLDPRTGMEMTVYAPANLRLKAWGVDGKITVRGWDAPVDVRAASGAIQIEAVKSGGASVLCPSCSMRLKGVRGPVRCMGGAGPVQLFEIDSEQTYVETGSGTITAAKVTGEQLYVTKEGSIGARELSGRIEFHAQSGPVDIIESSGFLSGRTTSGTITARMREWEFADKAVLESASGDIRLSLPSGFSGDVDLFSAIGKAEIGFRLEKTGPRELARPQLPGRITGRVGEGGELLKIFSGKGSIQVIQGG